MTKHTADLDHRRLLQLSGEVSRISASLAQLSMGLEDPAPTSIEPSVRAPEVQEEAVRWIINARKLRSRFLPDELFADPSWDMLLELLRAELAQQRVAVSSLCYAANVPATTALRHINAMVQQGLMKREPDPFDGRRVYVALVPEISNALRDYCACIFEKPGAAARAGTG